MTIAIDNEWPTLDLAELDDVPGHRVRHVPAIERSELPEILAAWLPTVMHAHRSLARDCDVHEFIDTTDGASARCVLTIDWGGNTHADIAAVSVKSIETVGVSLFGVRGRAG